MQLPDDVMIHIFSFMNGTFVADHYTARLSLTNPVWKPRYERRFDVQKQSVNYYELYRWSLQLEKHKKAYQRQWTLGCVGKITPMNCPLFPAAPSDISKKNKDVPIRQHDPRHIL